MEATVEHFAYNVLAAAADYDAVEQALTQAYNSTGSANPGRGERPCPACGQSSLIADGAWGMRLIRQLNDEQRSRRTYSQSHRAAYLLLTWCSTVRL